MSYTPEVTEEIVAEYQASPNRDTVNAIAERIGKSQKSVIAKLSSAGVYKTPERTTKTGEPIEKKPQMVTEISTWLGIEVPSLEKTGREDLKKLRNAIRDLLEAMEE